MLIQKGIYHYYNQFYYYYYCYYCYCDYDISVAFCYCCYHYYCDGNLRIKRIKLLLTNNFTYFIPFNNINVNAITDLRTSFPLYLIYKHILIMLLYQYDYKISSSIDTSEI